MSLQIFPRRRWRVPIVVTQVAADLALVAFAIALTRLALIGLGRV